MRHRKRRSGGGGREREIPSTSPRAYHFSEKACTLRIGKGVQNTWSSTSDKKEGFDQVGNRSIFESIRKEKEGRQGVKDKQAVHPD